MITVMTHSSNGCFVKGKARRSSGPNRNMTGSDIDENADLSC